MTDMDFLQTYLVPILYVLYAIGLLAKPPKMGASWGFCTKLAQRNEQTWQYAQRLSGIYCAAAGAILFLVVGLIAPPFWVQLVLELVLIACLYPVVTGLLKKKFPDDE